MVHSSERGIHSSWMHSSIHIYLHSLLTLQCKKWWDATNWMVINKTSYVEQGDWLRPGLSSLCSCHPSKHVLGFSHNYIALYNLQNTFTYIKSGCLQLQVRISKTRRKCLGSHTQRLEGWWVSGLPESSYSDPVFLHSSGSANFPSSMCLLYPQPDTKFWISYPHTATSRRRWGLRSLQPTLSWVSWGRVKSQAKPTPVFGREGRIILR